MPCNAAKTDRYLSFEGIECDAYAERVVGYIRDCIGDVENPSDWQSYFERKLVENAGMGQDDLFLVGSQINYIRMLFEHYEHYEHYEHGAGLELLDQIEEDCC